MTDKRKILASALLLLVFLGASLQGYAVTEISPEFNDTVMEKEIPLAGKDDVIIRGVFTDYDRGLSLPEFVKPEEAELVVNLSHGKELLGDISSMTVILNGKPLKSLMLNPENADNARLAVKIDPADLITGVNIFRFTFLMRSLRIPCADMDNPLNWSVLHKGSSIRLKFRTAKVLPVAFLEDAFCKAGPLFSQDTAIVLDGGADERAMQAGAIMANYLGRASGKARDIKVFYKNNLPSGVLDKYNAIFLTGEGAPKEGEAAISLSWAPWAKDKLLFTVAASKSGTLEKAAIYVANHDLSRFESDKAILAAKELLGAAVKPGKAPKAGGTFKDAGYSDVTVSGVFSKRTSFGFRRPANWKVENGIFRLIIQQSRFLVPQTSGITVEVNGTPVASKKFTGNPDKPFEVVARIPRHMLDSAYYFIQANFFLDIGQKDCNHQFKEKAWAVISGDSKFLMAHRYRAAKDLSDFPSLLMKGDRLMPTTLAVPDRALEDVLSCAMTIFSNIGALVPYDRGIPSIRKASTAPQTFADNNVIILGPPADFPWYGELGRDLPVGYDARRGSYVIAEDLPVSVEPGRPDMNFEGSYALMQTAVSPRNARRLVLAVSARDRGYSFLGNIMSDPMLYGTMSGDVVYASGANKIASYRLKAKLGVQVPDFLYTALWLAAVAAFGAAVIAVYVVVVRRNKL